MKRLLAIVLMTVLSITANAQGTWAVPHCQSDELKGQTAQNVYMYEVPGIGTVVVWDWKKPDFHSLLTRASFIRRMCKVSACVCP